MSRIVEGIKELLKKKDDDDDLDDYRYRYDQRQKPGSNRYYGYPENASLEGLGRSGYPSDGRSGSGYPTEVRSGSGYPTEMRSGSGYSMEGRSGSAYPTELRSGSGYPTEVRSGSGYPTEVRSGFSTEGRSGYPMEERSGYPIDGRSGYPSDGRSGMPEVRSGYAVSPNVDMRDRYSSTVNPDVRGAYATEPLGGYSVSPTAGGYAASSVPDVRGGYPTTATSNARSSTYAANTTAGGSYRKPFRQALEDDDDFRRATRTDPRGGYRVPNEPAYRGPGISSAGGEYRASARVDVPARGGNYERMMGSPHEGSLGSLGSKKVNSPSGYYETVAKTGILAPPTMSNRSRDSRDSRDPREGSRPRLGRMPSFAGGKVKYDGVGPRGQDYEAEDYRGFGRMPSFDKHRHHEAEYINSFKERPESYHGEPVAGIRRMPSFNRHRHNDAEYMSTDDHDYAPHSFHDTGSAYTSNYSDRPRLDSQVSFSKMPVENPHYMKRVGNY